MDHKEFSRKGGQAKSVAKTNAARNNARQPRKKIHACMCCGRVLYRTGEPIFDLGTQQYASLEVTEFIVRHKDKEVVEIVGKCCR